MSMYIFAFNVHIENALKHLPDMELMANNSKIRLLPVEATLSQSEKEHNVFQNMCFLLSDKLKSKVTYELIHMSPNNILFVPDCTKSLEFTVNVVKIITSLMEVKNEFPFIHSVIMNADLIRVEEITTCCPIFQPNIPSTPNISNKKIVKF